MNNSESADKDSDLPKRWRRWIAENKMLGVEDERIIEILLENGYRQQLAHREVRDIVSHPYFQAGMWMTQRLKKLESLLDVYRILSSLSTNFGIVERRRNLSRKGFLKDYYSRNRAVIIVDIMNNWKALELWSTDYLKSTCGDVLVEIMTGRNADPDYELNLDRHRTTVSFKDYIDMVMSGGGTNDYYMVANNFFLRNEGVKRLYEDIEMFPEYLDDGKSTDTGSFWFGPEGTITPLHHDVMNILLAQAVGRKRVILISPDQSHLVYNNTGVFSEVDCENPNYDLYPLFRQVKMIDITLEPGEVLFLPVGWWHYVRALDTSISISFINFVFPNSYDWTSPEISR